MKSLFLPTLIHDGLWYKKFEPLTVLLGTKALLESISN